MDVATKAKSGCPPTRDQFRRVIAREIKPPLGERPLLSLTPADLVDWSQGIIAFAAQVAGGAEGSLTVNQEPV